MAQSEQSPTLIYRSMQLGVALGGFYIIKFLLMVLTLNSTVGGMAANILTLAIPFVAYRLMKRYLLVATTERTPLTQTKLWQVGIFMFLFASMLSGVVEYLYYTYINPAFLSTQMNLAIEMLRQNSDTLQLEGNTLQLIDESLATQGVPTPIEMVMQSIWVNVVLGSIVSLVLSLILWHNRPKA